VRHLLEVREVIKILVFLVADGLGKQLDASGAGCTSTGHARGERLPIIVDLLSCKRLSQAVSFSLASAATLGRL
jgi:hypothetical protein